MTRPRTLALALLLAILAAVLTAIMTRPLLFHAQSSPDAERYMEAFHCSRLSPEMLAQLRDIVSYSGDTMLIKTKTGKTIELKSSLDEDHLSDTIVFCIADYFPEEGLLLVDIGLYEDTGFSAVNLNTGDVVHYDGRYTLSPNRKHMLHECISQYRLDFVQVLKPTSCGLVQEFIRTENNAFQNCEFSWKDDETIEMTYGTEREKNDPDKRMGRIFKGPDSWQLDQTKLFLELMRER